MLSTTTYPGQNPVGLPSTVAAMVGLLLVITTYTRSVRPTDSADHLWKRIQRLVLALTPASLFLAALASAGSPLNLHYRAFPGADDYSAVIIYVVLGFFFALHSIPLPRFVYQVNAALFTTAFGSLAILMPFRWWRPWADISDGYGLVICYWVLWLPTVMHYCKRARVRSRIQANVCICCGYSLSGNVSGVCPECGLSLRGHH